MIDDRGNAPFLAKGAAPLAAVLRNEGGYTPLESMVLQNDATMRRLQELGMKPKDALELIGRWRRRRS